jgi:hypothetical protein
MPDLAFGVFMKSLSRLVALAAELCAALAAFVGCTPKTTHESPSPAKQPEMHWHGQATGYEAGTGNTAQ